MISTSLQLPPKRPLLGINVSVVDYDRMVSAVMELAEAGNGGAAEFMCVHGLIESRHKPDFKAALNSFELVCPDGQPVRWALNKFHDGQLADRCYGPESTLRLCREAARRGVSVFFYGSSPEVIEKLCAKMAELCPGLRIAGAQSPPFRPLTEEEEQAVVDRFNASGAGLIFLGTGCPRQELLAHRLRSRVSGVLLCVGAAFDLHAGTRSMAPAWMQKHGMEWLFRLYQEPGRLWKRYLVYNSQFVYLVAREMLTGRPTTKPSVIVPTVEEEDVAAAA